MPGEWTAHECVDVRENKVFRACPRTRQRGAVDGAARAVVSAQEGMTVAGMAMVRARKGVVGAGETVVRAGKGVVRASKGVVSASKRVVHAQEGVVNVRMGRG